VITPQNIAESCNNALRCTLFLAKSARTLTLLVFTMNMRNNYAQNLRMFTEFFFLSSSEHLQTRSLDQFSRLIRHLTWICAR